jgi:uncharacterized membrane protein YbhN (UPF0104 family)
MAKRILHYLGILIAFGIFAAAVWILSQKLRHLEWAEVMAQLASIPLWHVVLALLSTAGAYLILTVYDSTAFSYIGRPVGFLRVAFVSFLAYAFSHTIGFGGATGGALRYRFYTGWGVKPIDIGKVILFGGLAYLLGAFGVAGALILTSGYDFAAIADLPKWVVHAVGGALAIAGCVYVLWSAAGRPSIRLGPTFLPPPRLSISLAQLTTAGLEWSFASAALYFLLPPGVGIDYWHFIGIYVLAYVAGMVSHVPQGLGVIEVVVMGLMPGAPEEAMAAAFITWRAVYFLLPLVIAAALYGFYEFRHGHLRPANMLRRAQRPAPPEGSRPTSGA